MTSPIAASSSLAAAPVARDRLAEASQDDLLGDRLELEVAAGGQEREAVLDLALEVASRAAEQRPEATIEAELLAVVADEVEHRADLPLGFAQSTTELLDEEHRAVGRPQKQERVDVAHVDRPR